MNISSLASVNPTPNSLVYAATKDAVDSITRVLARELVPRKIRINTIAPGGVETEGIHRIGVIGSDIEKEMLSNTPLGRFGQPEDIARVAVFLASEDAGWVDRRENYGVRRLSLKPRDTVCPPSMAVQRANQFNCSPPLRQLRTRTQ